MGKGQDRRIDPIFCTTWQERQHGRRIPKSGASGVASRALGGAHSLLSSPAIQGGGAAGALTEDDDEEEEERKGGEGGGGGSASHQRRDADVAGRQQRSAHLEPRALQRTRPGTGRIPSTPTRALSNRVPGEGRGGGRVRASRTGGGEGVAGVGWGGGGEARGRLGGGASQARRRGRTRGGAVSALTEEEEEEEEEGDAGEEEDEEEEDEEEEEREGGEGSASHQLRDAEEDPRPVDMRGGGEVERDDGGGAHLLLLLAPSHRERPVNSREEWLMARSLVSFSYQAQHDALREADPQRTRRLANEPQHSTETRPAHLELKAKQRLVAGIGRRPSTPTRALSMRVASDRGQQGGGVESREHARGQRGVAGEEGGGGGQRMRIQREEAGQGEEEGLTPTSAPASRLEGGGRLALAARRGWATGSCRTEARGGRARWWRLASRTGCGTAGGWSRGWMTKGCVTHPLSHALVVTRSLLTLTHALILTHPLTHSLSHLLTH